MGVKIYGLNDAYLFSIFTDVLKQRNNEEPRRYCEAIIQDITSCAANSTQDCRKLDPNGIVVLHQTDIGEYLRMEDEL
ncbi:hypothetical protein PRUPE_7G008800 [Prunus persica]|uniref:Uncharacterized protein n=1 Tax=Prunus persica TaxID=3760 RepID=M5VTZ0_PRUPE|nr:hypothetical protein PRUPE_7G008800 [Prunus persica]